MPPWERRRARLDWKLADMRRRHLPDKTLCSSDAPQVYFAYSAGRIKIGTSLDPRRRRTELHLQSPHPVTILMVLSGGSALEGRFHALLAKERKHGEWFSLSKEMRWLLHHSLCAAGMRRFKKAEAEFRAWLREMDQ